MQEFTHGDHQYRLRKIDTFTQFDILARVGPIVGPIFKMLRESGEGQEEADTEEARVNQVIAQMNVFLTAIRMMTDEERRFVLNASLGAMQRLQSIEGREIWADIYRNGRFMFDDIDNISDAIGLTGFVLREVLGGFLSIRADARTGSTAPAKPALVVATG